MIVYIFVFIVCKYVVLVVNICFIVVLRNLLLFIDFVYDDLMYSFSD